MKQLIVDSDYNQRLDKFLLKYLNKSSKSFVYKLLRKKRIKLNNKKASGNEILSKDDVITLYLSEETIEKFKDSNSFSEKGKDLESLDIIFEDDNIVIVNKPAGLLSQKDVKETTDTLNDRLLHYLHAKGEYNADSLFTPSICNRLDRNTSGIVVCAKNLLAAQDVNFIFSNRLIERYYQTIVKGIVNEDVELKNFYTKDIKKNMGSITDSQTDTTKEIYTKIKRMKNSREYSLLDVEIISGKSHQIRIQLQNIGHPIIGDRKYGDKQVNDYFDKYDLKYQLLHSYKIIFKNKEGFLSYLYGKEFIAEKPEMFVRIENQEIFESGGILRRKV